MSSPETDNFRRPCSAKLLPLLTALLCVPVMASDVARDRAEQAFLQQLTERQFFDLAEQHCRRLMTSAVTTDEQAKWQLRLAQTCEKHAWFAEAASRRALLNESVTQVSDFLTRHSPPLDLNLQLRLQLVSTMTQSVRIALVLAEAGHLSGKPERTDLAPARTPAQTLNLTSNLTPETLAACIATVDQAAVMVEGLLQHLDQTRNELDVNRGRVIRRRARLALGELLALKWRLTPHEQSLQSRAEDALNLASRSAKDPHEQRKAAWLLAELTLYASSREDFQLRLKSANSSAAPTLTDDLHLPVFLQIRDHLQRQEAVAATRLADDTQAHTALQRQQLEWLKLESALGLKMLADQLDDQPLQNDASQKFIVQTQQARRTTSGVFRDAVERVVRRKELIDEVGVAVADLIEQIERMRAAAEQKAALQLIDLTLQQLPPARSMRARGALQLRAGEILIQQQQWPAAVDRLAIAVDQFDQSAMPPEAAVADLLRIFAMAQLVAAGDTEDAVSESEYTAALEDHLTRFSDQPTAQRAGEWLRQLVVGSDPRRAAELALQQSAAAQNPVQKVALLTQAGQHIRSAQWLNTADELTSLQERFQQQLSTMLSSPDTFPPNELRQAQLLQLHFDVQRAEPGENRWDEFRSRLNQLKPKQVSRPDGSEQIEDTDDAFERQLLEAVILARTTTDLASLSGVRNRLLKMDDHHLKTAVSMLDSQYAGRTLQGGDTWLAAITSRLLERLIQQTATNSRMTDVVLLLPIAARAAALTGQSNSLENLLDRVLEQPVDETVMKQIAAALAAADNAAAGPGSEPGSPAANGVRGRFWARLLSSEPQGADLWLEASLQLAMLAAAEGHEQKARQRLAVVETLYPDWGDPGRRRRADTLINRLKNETSADDPAEE
ncbi:MAG: hypothetical protein RIK87_05725 [Fuerstiella sp.]